MHLRPSLNKIISVLMVQAKGSEFRAKIVQGGALVSAGTALEHFTRFIRNMILTRLLMPEVLGVMAIVLATHAAFEAFTEIGLKQVIIQNKDGEEKKFLNGAWFFSLLRALFLYSVAFIFTPSIAQFYNNPDLNELIRIAFLSIIFKGMISPRAYVAIKRMQFMKWLFIQNGGGILGVITTIILVYLFPNIWALIIGFTLENLYMFIISYIICPFLPGFKFESESIKAIRKYALGMLGLPILTFIFLRADVFVLGKLVDRGELGLYTMAVALANASMQFFSTIISQVGMPAFSEIQDDNEKINNGLYKVTKLISLIFFPALVVVILFGKKILHLVYGLTYAQVAIPFAILFGTGMSRLMSQPIAVLYFALGKPQYHRFFVGIRAVLICVIIYPAIKYFGLIGAASATLFSMLISYIVQLMILRKTTHCDLIKYTSFILKGSVYSLIIIIVWFVLFRHYLFL